MEFDPFEGLGTPEEYLESFERDKPSRLRPCHGCGEDFFFPPDEHYCTEACELQAVNR